MFSAIEILMQSDDISDHYLVPCVKDCFINNDADLSKFLSIYKRAAQKMERSWRKTKVEVFSIAWRDNTLFYKKALKTARSAYFMSLLE